MSFPTAERMDAGAGGNFGGHPRPFEKRGQLAVIVDFSTSGRRATSESTRLQCGGFMPYYRALPSFRAVA
jgi:hypothetical protein